MAIINREAKKIQIGTPNNESGLPRLSLVLSREDGQHTSCTTYPMDHDIVNLSDQVFFDTYVRPMLAYARGRYKSEIT